MYPQRSGEGREKQVRIKEESRIVGSTYIGIYPAGETGTGQVREREAKREGERRVKSPGRTIYASPAARLATAVQMIGKSFEKDGAFLTRGRQSQLDKTKEGKRQRERIKQHIQTTSGQKNKEDRWQCGKR